MIRGMEGIVILFPWFARGIVHFFLWFAWGIVHFLLWFAPEANHDSFFTISLLPPPYPPLTVYDNI